MTMIDVREAEAGLAVDVACAEAMGWEYTDSHFTIGAHAIEGAEGTVWFFTNKGNVRATGDGWHGNWQPSTDWAAWVLVEAMRDSGSLSDDATGVQRRFIDALVELMGVDNSLLYYDACEWLTYRALWTLFSAGPLAICRAFLIDSGIEEIEDRGQSD